ncbi:replication restart helicase PriA [Floccifex sp.]|uniref:replication restart helicase PriA n=1 Tax=Floccifex sp. TaxID=2815810 RepID=UPI003F0717D4
MKINVYVEQSTMELNKPFTYQCDSNVQVGCRVRVPFRNKEYIGIVHEINVQSDVTNIKKVIEVIDEQPLLNDELMKLAYWMSKTYVAPLISCFKTMLPPALKPSSSHAKIVKDQWAYVQESHETLNPRQQKVLQDIVSKCPMKASVYRKYTKSYAKVFIEKGYIVLKEVEKNSVQIQTSKDTSFALTTQQKQAIQTIQQSNQSIFLLHGVTGSGKTEVFLQLASEAISKGKQVLFLVPEIGLTPMMIQRVSARFGTDIAIYHSQLNDQEKYAQYKLVQEKKVKIVVGTRSAVFMPFHDLGLILMDEEHDSSYKQDNSPRYVTKDIVIERSKVHQCKVVFASATPSLDSYARAYKGIFQLVNINQRVNQKMPYIHLIDMKKEQTIFGLSQTLIQKMEECLQRKEQIILLLNRRGYLPVVKCSTCNEVLTCPDCGIALTYHKIDQSCICHCCGRVFYFHHECPNCHGHEFYQLGMGTEKLEEKISSLFPDAHIVRMDADSTRKKNAHAKLLKEFEEKGDILIGTQMVAKGLDFARVTLVGIIQADQALIRNDFSSSEICYQMLEQASGRAGRSEKEGNVYIQTFDPSHFVMQSVINHDYISFFIQEMKYRHLGKYPPYIYMCTLIYVHKDLKKIEEVIEVEKETLLPLKILGPIVITPRRQVQRMRLVLKASSKDFLTNKVNELMTFHRSLKSNVKIEVNMYPMRLEE